MTSTADRLVDAFGRVHTNLRISVTDRCNIRCVYCMPESVTFLPRNDLLTFEEIERVARVSASLGINKVRLTGGEPLVRRDLVQLVARLVAVPGIDDLGLTTNGILLAPLARPLRDAGLRRINISLDTLDPERFRALTRRDGLEKVIEGIKAAKAVGLDPVKLNAIALKGTTETELIPLARFAREQGAELRFIEYMPLDAGAWERDKVLLASEILDRLTDEFGPLIPDPDQDPRAPAMDYDYSRRRWAGRPDRLGEPIPLRKLQPASPDGRWEAPQLPVRPRRNRPEADPPRPSSRRRHHRRGDPPERGVEVGRARDQLVPVHPTRAADACHRRLRSSLPDQSVCPCRGGPMSRDDEAPWYRDGLAFTCTQCGACCTGAPVSFGSMRRRSPGSRRSGGKRWRRSASGSSARWATGSA